MEFDVVYCFRTSIRSLNNIITLNSLCVAIITNINWQRITKNTRKFLSNECHLGSRNALKIVTNKSKQAYLYIDLPSWSICFSIDTSPLSFFFLLLQHSFMITAAAEIQLGIRLKNAWPHWTMANMGWHFLVGLECKQQFANFSALAIISSRAMIFMVELIACSIKSSHARELPSISSMPTIWIR